LTAGDFARQYQMRAALSVFVVGNALNMALSGHSVFDNKDIFSLELGDGSAVHPYKHWTEPFHWIGNFGKTFENKLGIVPRLASKTRGMDNEQAAKEVLKSMLPFSTPKDGGSLGTNLAAFVGVPRTGEGNGHIGGQGIPHNVSKLLEKGAKKLGINISLGDPDTPIDFGELKK
jgi:hypothetical protein